MKLRLDERSARLRLNKSDIEALKNQGFVKNAVSLPGGYLEYSIESRTDVEKVECMLTGPAFLVLLPAALSEQWVQSDEVGVYAAVPVGNDGKVVEIVLEKDFPCRHGDPGTQSGRFNDLANQ